MITEAVGKGFYHSGGWHREPYALAGLWCRYFEGSETRYSFTIFTTEPNDFMRPIHEKAMPVILANIDEQKLWQIEGDEFGFLYPFAFILSLAPRHPRTPLSR